MLPERQTQLLTAYVDGELGPDERQRARQLLRKSPAARALLRQLAQDARRLRGLIAPPAPDISGVVVQAIAQRRPPVPASARRRPRALPTWVGMAVAASVLLAVTGGSFLFFSRFSGPTVAQNAQPREPAFRLALDRLGSEAERARLERELRKNPACYLNLQCQDAIGAVHRLHHALQDRGVQMVMDRAAREQLEKKEHKTSYLLYAENLRPEEVAAILRQVGSQGHTPGPPAPSDTVVVTGLTQDRRLDLARRLGVGLDKLAPANDDGATSQEAAALGHRSTEPQRLALVLAQDAARPGPEVQEFLKRRRAGRPGTLQVLVVLRETSA